MKLNITETDFLKKLPKSPGVYRFYDKDNMLLYVGKAISIYNRVKSYFQKNPQTSPRITLMIQKISHIEVTVTENETAALILENNLIKELKPKYNIIFRDDKTYPLIRISEHQFPRIDYYRGKILKNNTYFGPYPNATATKQTIDTIQKIFQLRTCSDNFFSSRKRPCMLHQLKRCTAPCIRHIDSIKYAEQVNSAKDFLNGRLKQLTENLSKKMYQAADKMEFEVAASIRDKIIMIKHTQANRIITTQNKPLSADLIIHDFFAGKLYLYIVIIRNGMYIGNDNFTIDVIEQDYVQSCEVFLENHYLVARNTKLIILDLKLDQKFIDFFSKALQIKITNHISSTIERLFTIGKINLQNNIESSKNYLNEAVNVLSELLNNHPIRRIECIDISHHHGENTVASIVVFDNEIIDNSQYRKFNLSATINGNDLAAMETVWNRRLSQIDNTPPDVILVDGGKLQLEAVKNIVTKHGLCGKIKVVAIFKGEKRNPELDKLLLEQGNVIRYRDAPKLFKLLQQLRDEAHRFAITGHRKKQIKKMSTSVITQIPNIGTKKRKELLMHFGSAKAVSEATIVELQEVPGIGYALANQIYSYFH